MGSARVFMPHPLSRTIPAMQTSQRFMLAVAGVLGALGVVAGAFAAHALKDRLDASDLNAFEVGVDYQIYHAIALLALAALPGNLWESRTIRAAAWLWLAGILCFSGSLYGLAFTDWRWLGPVTPLGGTAFIAGWACIVAAAFTVRKAD